MKNIFIIALAWMIGSSTSIAQIMIDGSDMPSPGDTARFSNTLVLDGIDYEMTGEGVTWDFSGLTVMSQDVDTFSSPASTPLGYQLVFNNPIFYPSHLATVALRNSAFDFIPQVDVSSAFQFYKTTDLAHSEIGVGVTLSDIPLAVPYDQFDVLYQLPLAFDDEYFSTAAAEFDLPGLGYFMFNRSRDNIVEGWGTLITPFGTFETLKLRSDIEEYDSIYVDSLNMGFPLNRTITEYKWLAKGYPWPVLTVTAEGFVVTASYIDSLRNSFLAVDEIVSDPGFLSVYPNPSSEYFNVSYDLENACYVSLELYSMAGQRMLKEVDQVQSPGSYSRAIFTKDKNLPGGTYLLRLCAGEKIYTQRVIIN